MSMNQILADAIAERQRQIHEKGFDKEHDKQWKNGELANAAATYAMSHKLDTADHVVMLWPWAITWWKPKTRRQDLIRAIALLMAEIERIESDE